MATKSFQTIQSMCSDIAAVLRNENRLRLSPGQGASETEKQHTPIEHDSQYVQRRADKDCVLVSIVRADVARNRSCGVATAHVFLAKKVRFSSVHSSVAS